MRFTVIAALLAIACRSSDGRSQSAPPATPPSPPAGDSASAEAMMKRADLARIMGDTAGLWVLVVSDFQCPFCKRWHDETFATLVREYVRTGKVRLAYVNLPLQQHTHAQEAAEAAMCAGAQDRFWPMQDALFATQEQWAPLARATPVFDSLARSIGLDTTQWRQCRRSDAVGRYVDGDRNHVIQVGVRSTPTFLIGSSTRIEGAQPIAVFRRAIDDALRADSARAH